MILLSYCTAFCRPRLCSKINRRRRRSGGGQSSPPPANSRSSASARTRKRLNPYKRIILGLSIGDILQSLALVTGPFAPPVGTLQSPFAAGNTVTCEINGVFMTSGSCAVTMYTCGLCIYYWCKIVHRMSNEHFARTIERYIHLTVIVSNAGISLASLITKTYNTSPLGGFCYFAALPLGCKHGQNDGLLPGGGQQCTRGNLSFIFTFISTIGLPSLSFAGIVMSMTALICHAVKKKREFNTEQDTQQRSRLSCIGCGNHQDSNITRNSSSFGQYLTRLYVREAVLQSSLYVLGFVAVYIVPLILALQLTIDKKTNLQDSELPLLFTFLFPLGGLYNILVYTRPNISSLRRREPTISWLKAFLLVVRAGGESPQQGANTRRQQKNTNIGAYSNRIPPKKERQSQVNLASIANEGGDGASFDRNLGSLCLDEFDHEMMEHFSIEHINGGGFLQSDGNMVSMGSVVQDASLDGVGVMDETDQEIVMEDKNENEEVAIAEDDYSDSDSSVKLGYRIAINRDDGQIMSSLNDSIH